MDMIDVILDKPLGFKLKRKQYYIYPSTLGKKMLDARILEKMDIRGINIYQGVLFLVLTQRENCIRIIATHTLKTKEEVLNAEIVNKRIKELSKMNNEDIASLLIYILSEESIETFEKHIGLNIDKSKKEKIARIKKDNKNHFVFGGKSIYGTIISVACEKYGWTMDYVVWGISYTNLVMLLEDSINEIYLTDEERKRANISNDTEIINADDPKNRERILAMFK